ncbi:MAG: CxxxxCH/CxxCH domain-containing protein, partial [Fidelibacterota bacterium]
CHPESLPVHTHDPGFLDYDSPLFHASDYIWDNGTELCTGCHGDDLTGGISLTTCRTCHAEDLPYHAHGPSALDPFSTDYHGKLLWDNGWNFSACEACHGDDLNGGIVNIGCTTSCHQEQDGLGNCGNCHGDRISGDPAPPLGIMNSSDPGELSVGAHQEHLNSSIAVVSCSDCHLVPSDYMDSDHLGSDNRAEVVITEDFNYYQLTPEYDYSSGTCSNTYCHGGFSFPKESSSSQWVHTQDEIVGNNQPMVWNDVQDLTCTVCHGLPPAGHLDNGISCSVCHSSVVDDSLQIINTSLHINGEINQN